jgi:hypothetical protein
MFYFSLTNKLKTMFTKSALTQTIVVAMLSTVSFISCSKEDSVQVPTQPKPMQLIEFSGGGDMYKFAYNSDASLKTITLGHDPLTGDENVTYTVAYLPNKKVDELTGSNGSRIKLAYANHLLSKAETFLGTEKIAVSDYTYTGETLKGTEINLIDNNIPYPFFKADFVFNAAGNITRTNAFVYNPFTNAMEAGGYVNKQYDNKANPFASLGDIALIFWQVAPKNNITKEEYFSKDGLAEEVIETTYSYNTQGYPVRATIKENAPGQPPVTATLSYTYRQQ